MKAKLWALLRKGRYALPGLIGRLIPAPSAASVLRTADRLARRDIRVTLGYFQGDTETADPIAAANRAAIRLAQGRSPELQLAIKAPPMAFDAARIRELAAAAFEAGISLVFDSHAHGQADNTLALVDGLLTDFPGTGLALPARWQRSIADAGRFRDTSARIRIVKGEWPDPGDAEGDVSEAYLELVSRLAGRDAPVAVATHDPALAQAALTLLQSSGTPCQLEQLRGLPRRRTSAIAGRLGVPVRIYLPYGPGWWPYAINGAVARPHLIAWTVRDRLASLS